MIIYCLRSGLLAAFLAIGVAALFLNCPSIAAARTDACAAQQQTIELLRSRIKADQKAIKDLGIGITEPDLDDATNIAENGRKKAMLAAALSLVDGFLSAPEGALGTKSLDGIELRNGLGSVGTGQANALIGKIRAEGGAKQALIPLLRRLSQISVKTSQLEYLDALSKAGSALKAVAELGGAEDTLEEAEAVFALATAMVGPVALADSVVNAVLNSAKNETQIYLMAKDIDRLTNTAEKQLKALKALSAKLEVDVKTLQRMSGTDVCDRDISWQIVLQNQRMEAAAAGNIDLYNQLLRIDAEIFKRLGLRPCESGYYPGGCNSTTTPKRQSAQGPSGSCPFFSPRNAQDALQVEKSSFKDVCWAYNGKTLVAIGSKSPDKANKPSPSSSGSGGVGPASEMPALDGAARSPSQLSETASDGAAPDAIVTKTSHSTWDTLHPLQVGRGQTSVHYYPARDSKSYIYVAHLVTKSQLKRDSQAQAQLQWCSALLFNGKPFTYDAFAHNHNYAVVGTCVNLDYARFDIDEIDEKGRPVRAPSGERVYVEGSRIEVEFEPGPFNPGAYALLVCPPFRPFSGKLPEDFGDTPIYRLGPRTNWPPTELTCQSEDFGLHGMGKEHWLGPLAPLGTFNINMSPGMSATVTVKSY